MQPGTDALVQGGTRRYGRFATRPTDVNPLDEYPGLRGRLKALRLKEWVGFTLIHPAAYSSLIVQDAHYLASSEIYAYLRSSGDLHQHAVNARGGSVRLPADLLSGRCRFDKRGYRIEYRFDQAAGRHVLRVEIAATPQAPAFAGELELDARQASSPLSVSAQLPGGAMYTHKVIYPARGVLRVGDEELVFDPARDFAILDEHRSLLPYRTRWVWGTFAQRAGAGIVGANFAERPSAPGAEEESCLWLPGRTEPLAEIRFEPASAAALAPWRITSADGRLDVTFTPEGRKDVKHQLGLFAIDYYQLFGHYRGVVRGSDGDHAIDDAHGVCERMRARL